MPQESRILSTEPNEEQPWIFIKGIDKVIKLDLGKNKALLERFRREEEAYKQSISGLIQKKRYYKGLIGGGKFNDESLRESIKMMNVDISDMNNKVNATQQMIAFHKEIVDTLTTQLLDYERHREYIEQHHGNNL